MLIIISLIVIFLGLGLGILGVTSKAVVAGVVGVNLFYVIWLCYDLYWRKK